MSKICTIIVTKAAQVERILYVPAIATVTVRMTYGTSGSPKNEPGSSSVKFSHMTIEKQLEEDLVHRSTKHHEDVVGT